MKNICLFTIAIFTLIRCKEEPSKTEIINTSQITPEKVEPNMSFVVSMNFKTNSKDKFRIMMNGITVDEFQIKNVSFVEDVEPTTDFEKLEADFGSSDFSRNVVINLGFDNEKIITIKDFQFSYGPKTITVNNNNYNSYLGHNKFVVRDSIKGTFTTKKISGQSFNPVIFIRQTVFNELMNP